MLNQRYKVERKRKLCQGCRKLTIIGQGWAKYRELSVASRSIICRSRRLRQIIDLRDISFVANFSSFSLETTTWPANNCLQIMVCSCTVSSTEFNNCFIIQSPSKFFYKYLREAAIFTQERSQEGEKRAFIYAWAEYYLQPNTKPNTGGWRCAWADHYL